jgi:hypothetical protein
VNALEDVHGLLIARVRSVGGQSGRSAHPDGYSNRELKRRAPVELPTRRNWPSRMLRECRGYRGQSERVSTGTGSDNSKKHIKLESNLKGETADGPYSCVIAEDARELASAWPCVETRMN